MDALVPCFILALLAEIGDRTQLQAMALSARFARPLAVMGGIALAAALNMAIAGAAGVEVGAFLPHRAAQLFTGIALILAGAGAPFRVKPPPTIQTWRLGAFLSSAGAFFILALGDKTQFAVGAIAAGSGKPWLAAAGGAAGVVAGNAPAVFLGERWATIAPLRALRMAAGGALVLAGVALVIVALQIG